MINEFSIFGSNCMHVIRCRVHQKATTMAVLSKSGSDCAHSGRKAHNDHNSGLLGVYRLLWLVVLHSGHTGALYQVVKDALIYSEIWLLYKDRRRLHKIEQKRSNQIPRFSSHSRLRGLPMR